MVSGLHSSSAVEGEMAALTSALEGDKVSKMRHGKGLGLGSAVLGCVLKLEEIPPCYGEKSDHREAGAGGCAGHWAQLPMALAPVLLLLAGS